MKSLKILENLNWFYQGFLEDDIPYFMNGTIYLMIDKKRKEVTKASNGYIRALSFEEIKAINYYIEESKNER